jgi:hypothetical protein
MKKLITYQCEICGGKFVAEEGAVRCESRGLSKEYPVGLIYAYMLADGKDPLIIMVLTKFQRNDHYFDGTVWAARDWKDKPPKESDNADHEGCEFSEPRYAPPQDSPAFKRAIQFCVRKGLTPQIWDGEKIIPYENPDRLPLVPAGRKKVQAEE